MDSNHSLTVAAIQLAVPENLSPKQQCERLMPMIQGAAERGASLVVLPELCLHRYFPQEIPTSLHLHEAEQLAEPLKDHWFLLRLHKLAKALNIRIIASVYEQAKDRLRYNTLVLVTSASPMAETYRKVHLPDDPKFHERSYFAAGEALVTWPGSPCIGPMVCYDQWYPEAARITTLRGAQLLVYPTAIGWDADEPAAEQARQHDAWITIQRSHAIANMVFVVACNRVGVEAKLTFWGSSFIAAPGGEVLAMASNDQEEIIIAEVDLTKIETLRQAWPLLADRQPAVYGRGLLTGISSSP